jgi:4-carboxymuconolactone decarboxylase
LFQLAETAAFVIYLPRMDFSFADHFGGAKGRALTALFSRADMAAQQRFLCTAACLQAIGEYRDLAKILGLALDAGVEIGAIYEVLLQGYLFCGYPRAIESFISLDEILIRRGMSLDGFRAQPLDPAESLLKRGTATAETVHRDKFARIHDRISAVCPDLGYLMVAEGYGHILSRPGLKLDERELAVVSTLTALGSPRQLNSHIRGASNVGSSPTEILAAIVTTVPWVGFAAAQAAVNIWAAVIGVPAIDIEVSYPDLRV